MSGPRLHVSDALTELDDHYYMGQALALAKEAFVQNEVPIGSVIVDASGAIVARGYNQSEQRHCQVFHAEMVALMEAGTHRKDWRLEGCWVYVTLEPCSMCVSAIALSRAKGVVFATSSPLFGFHLDNKNQFSLYNSDAFLVKEGVRKEESQELLKQFFDTKRIRV